MIKQIIRYRDLLVQLVTKDLKLKYRRSFLGYVWSILNPLAIMMIMTLVFSNVFRYDIEHYPVYLIIGQTLYNYMNNSTTHSIYSILDNGALLKKVYVPKYIFTIAKVTSGLVDFIFSLAAMFFVMIITGTPFSFYLLLIPFVAAQLYLFCVGLGLFLAQASVFFRDIRYIYNVVLTGWMYLTPIFYPVEILTSELRWCIQHLNPMYFYVQQFRDLVLSRTLPSMTLIISGCVASIAMLLIGSACFKKTQSKFILYI